VSLSGNYTWAYCVGNSTPESSAQFSTGYLKPDDPSFDRGNCNTSRTHIGNVTVGVQTPQFDNPALRVVASNWRVSGIIGARSGSWLTVTTNQDIAGTGISGQRVNLVSDDVYGDKTLTNYLNRAAFELPAAGTLGDLRLGSIRGPGFWTVDLGLSRLVGFRGPHTMEFRVEAFNLLNNFNWGDPTTNFDSGQFGRITTNGGTPRIMQFAVKYAF
jgi:hypothetical protein